MFFQPVLRLIQCVAVYGLVRLLWRICRQLIAGYSLNNIPGPPPQSFLKVNRMQLHSLDGLKFQRELIDRYEPVVRLKGPFGRNHLLVYDPLALQNIIIKDQDIYQETLFLRSMSRVMFGDGLISAAGERHRKQCKLLNPVFSTSQMRHLHPVFYEVAYKLWETIASKITDGPKEIDIFNWLGRAALELIGQGGLGYSFDPLMEDSHDTYSNALKSLLVSMSPLFPFRSIVPFLFTVGPPKFRRWLVEHAPFRIVQEPRRVIDIMDHSTRHILNIKKLAIEKNEAGLDNLGEDRDVLSTLLKANMAASKEDRISEEEVLGQLFTLVFAATDTTSSAISQIVFQLAHHQGVQDKLRAEIINARRGRETIPYDELSSLPYLDSVCRETLRVHPPGKMIGKTAAQDVVMPLSTPIKGVDGTLIKEIFVPEGTDVYVGILASNCNPALWGKDAHEWNPDRWLAPLPEALIGAHIPGVYANLMTFLGGGRACIGFRFSPLEMKIVLAVLLEAFTFAPSEKPISWNMSGVEFPTVGTGPTTSAGSLPMIVDLVQN